MCEPLDTLSCNVRVTNYQKKMICDKQLINLDNQLFPFPIGILQSQK